MGGGHYDTCWMNIQRARRQMIAARAKTYVGPSPQPREVPPFDIEKLTHPFFRMPAELRNRIYYYILVDTPDKAIYAHPLRKEPKFLLASRQIRKEALPIYYGYNVFKVSEAVTMPTTYDSSYLRRDISCGPPAYHARHSLLRQWLQWLGPERVGMIKHFRIVYNEDCEGPAMYPDHDFWNDQSGRHVSWYGLQSWAEQGGEADGARVAAKLMLEGLREDGLMPRCVEPVLSIRMEPEEQAFQIRWVRAMEELKKEMADEVEYWPVAQPQC